MRGLALFLLSAVAVGTTGCDKIPGTPQNKAATAIRTAAFDPGAVKLTFVADTPHAVCGTMNGKNRMGAYVGATPFLYDKATGRTLIYGGQPESYDIRRLDGMGSSDPEWLDLMTEITAECAFPTE